MKINEILLAGGMIQFSYKENVNDWVGDGKIYVIAPNCGLKAMVVVNIPTFDGYYKEFSYNEMDKAIELFNRLIFSEKNLWYKHHEALIELDDITIDLEIEEDFERYEKKRLELINKEK